MCYYDYHICIVPLPSPHSNDSKRFHLVFFITSCQTEVTLDEYNKLPRRKRSRISHTVPGQGKTVKYRKLNINVLQEHGDPRSPDIIRCEKTKGLPKRRDFTIGGMTPQGHRTPNTECRICLILLARRDDEEQLERELLSEHTTDDIRNAFATYNTIMEDDTIPDGVKGQFQKLLSEAQKYLGEMKRKGEAFCNVERQKMRERKAARRPVTPPSPPPCFGASMSRLGFNY